jgi:AraC family transcriptional regulator
MSEPEENPPVTIKKNVVAAALDVGYAHPSHFAQLFRRETSLSSRDYGRQR